MPNLVDGNALGCVCSPFYWNWLCLVLNIVFDRFCRLFRESGVPSYYVKIFGSFVWWFFWCCSCEKVKMLWWICQMLMMYQMLVHVYLKHLSTPDVCNRIKKNLTGFEREHFSPKNVMPERLCSAFFRAIEDLRFHHCQIRVLTTIMTIKLNS